MSRPGKRRKKQWSKIVTLAVIVCGMVIAQECLALMWLAISRGYTATAAWLTAAVGLAEAVIGTGLTGYLSLCRVEHSAGGITYEAAKAKNYEEDISV